jgi:divalent metal cation (Fe/Co/Zn/Cd) transporter
MERAFRTVVGLLLLAVGGLLGLYGLFAILYRDHSGGSTYVTLFGHERDAHAVGAASLLVAAVLIAAAVFLIRLRRRRG